MNKQIDKFLVISAPPHIRSGETIQDLMRDVIVALLPAFIAANYFFGYRTLLVVAMSVLVAVATEAATQRVLKREITINDLSAVVTGLLLAFTLPANVPLWIPALGAILAIFLIKQLFGGLGYNWMNPALGARAILLSSWPVPMTTWMKPVTTWFSRADVVTGATPLAIAKGLEEVTEKLPSYYDLFIGRVGGSLGETSALALILGAGYLFYKKVIDWRIPSTFIGTVLFLTLLLGRDPIYYLFAGGLLLGAFFMATDPVTTPVTKRGRLIFGFACGVITVLVRFYGGYPEGVCYSILFMNCLTPLIDLHTQPRVFGEVKGRA